MCVSRIWNFREHSAGSWLCHYISLIKIIDFRFYVSLSPFLNEYQCRAEKEIHGARSISH